MCGADRLPVPARDAGEPMGDVLDLDVERRGVEEVEPAPGEHPLPGARRPSRGLTSAPLAPSAAHSAWRKQPDEVVVDHADRLHEGVDDGRPAEGEALRLQRLRDRGARPPSRPAPRRGSAASFWTGRPSTKLPQEAREALAAPGSRARRARSRSCPRSWRGCARCRRRASAPRHAPASKRAIDRRVEAGEGPAESRRACAGW